MLCGRLVGVDTMNRTDFLRHLIAEAAVLAGGDHPCKTLGHRWKHVGGKNCGCPGRSGCSVPVHQCEACGDYDYGDNEESEEIIRHCKETHDDDPR